MPGKGDDGRCFTRGFKHAASPSSSPVALGNADRWRPVYRCPSTALPPSITYRGAGPTVVPGGFATGLLQDRCRNQDSRVGEPRASTAALPRIENTRAGCGRSEHPAAEYAPAQPRRRQAIRLTCAAGPDRDAGYLAPPAAAGRISGRNSWRETLAGV